VGYDGAGRWGFGSQRPALPGMTNRLLRGGAPQRLFFDDCPTFRAATNDTVTRRTPAAPIKGSDFLEHT